MSKFDKALERLKRKPKDFTWKELQTIMIHFGYKEIKGGGSRRKFIHSETLVVVSLHEPHPKPQIKEYALEIIINHLKEEGKL
jgi:predicted RNA binding protein YcfA (HicA-like mRNA interferase family)